MLPPRGRNPHSAIRTRFVQGNCISTTRATIPPPMMRMSRSVSAAMKMKLPSMAKGVEPAANQATTFHSMESRASQKRVAVPMSWKRATTGTATSGP